MPVIIPIAAAAVGGAVTAAVTAEVQKKATKKSLEIQQSAVDVQETALNNQLIAAEKEAEENRKAQEQAITVSAQKSNIETLANLVYAKQQVKRSAPATVYTTPVRQKSALEKINSFIHSLIGG